MQFTLIRLLTVIKDHLLSLSSMTTSAIWGSRAISVVSVVRTTAKVSSVSRMSSSIMSMEKHLLVTSSEKSSCSVVSV